MLHLALGGRYSNVNAGSLRFRGVPEAGNLPLYVDTDVFDADRMTNTNVQIYYQKGPLWVANEYLSTWTLTGEAMPYDRQRTVFLPMTPATPAPDGGTGLVQLAVRYSMVDLQDRGVMGGRMSRLSGGINWYPTGTAIVNFHYGRARLERGGKTGTTHIFQMRLFLLM